MSTRTLSPAALRAPAPRRHASRVLVVVAEGAAPPARGPAPDGTAVPGWAVPERAVPERAVPERAVPERAVPERAAAWCGRADWELRMHPDVGPAAAAAAARLDTRVLLLRAATPTAATPVQDRPAEREAAVPRPLPGARDRGTAQDRPAEPEAPVSCPRVVAAVRGLPDDAPVVADAAACAARTGGRLTVVHAVPRSFAGRSVGLDGAVTHGRRLLDAAADHATAQEPGLHVERHLLRVRPYELVGEALHADLLVVGGPRTGRGATGCGLVAHSALHHAPCPVLLTPR